MLYDTLGKVPVNWISIMQNDITVHYPAWWPGFVFFIVTEQGLNQSEKLVLYHICNLFVHLFKIVKPTIELNFGTQK